MRLFHRTSTERATEILRDGFKDNSNPPGHNFGFHDQIPPIKDVWFSDFPVGANPDEIIEQLIFEPVWGTPDGDTGVLFLLTIPDEIIEQLKERDGLHGKIEAEFTPEEIAHQEEFGAPYQEFLIPAEVANQYGPPIDVTDDEEEYMPIRPPRPDGGAFMGDFDMGEFLWMDKPADWLDK